MRKLIICLAVATVAVSCKKIQAGGNKNILKMEKGADRYSDDHQGGTGAHEVVAAHKEEATATKHEAAPKADSTVAKPAEAQTKKAEH